MCVWAIGQFTEVFSDNYGFVRRIKVKTKTFQGLECRSQNLFHSFVLGVEFLLN